MNPVRCRTLADLLLQRLFQLCGVRAQGCGNSVEFWALFVRLIKVLGGGWQENDAAPRPESDSPSPVR